MRFKLSCLRSCGNQHKVLLECNLQASVKRADFAWGRMQRLAIITGQVPSPGLGVYLPRSVPAESLLARRSGTASFALSLRPERQNEQMATRLTVLSRLLQVNTEVFPLAADSCHRRCEPNVETSGDLSFASKRHNLAELLKIR